MSKNFTVVDYLVFGMTFVISAGVGIFHAWKAARKPTNPQTEKNEKTEDFLIGGRKLPVLPVSLSLMTTFVSGFSLLGVPAEIYQRGALMWVYQMMGAPVLLICAYLFLPIFYKIRPISIYEYFELRYGSRGLRRLASTLFLLNTMFYMAVVMYAPAVALSAVTSVQTWPLILSVGLVCTFYTTLGGLKAVVWTDTIQAAFMFGGVIALIIKGSSDSGGFWKVWEIASDGGRFKPLSFLDPNPAQYFSFWIAIFGGLTFWFSLYGLNQMAVQRYCSLASLRQARQVIAITVPTYVLLLSMCGLIGLVMLAYFWQCDPLESGEIQTKDQLVIYFVTKTLKSVPGLPGLFLACLFSGTLSTVSSGINSMAAVTWGDFLKHSRYTSNISDTRATLISKALVCIFGFTSLVLAFAAEPMGGIIQAAISMMGSLAGPLRAIRQGGLSANVYSNFFEIVSRNVWLLHKYGAIIGCLVSMFICVWITLGSIIYKPYATYKLPMNNSQCPAVGENVTAPEMNSIAMDFDPHYGNPHVLPLYRISSFFFSFIGIVLVIVIAPIVSLVVKPRKGAYVVIHKRSIAYTVFGNEQRIPSDENCADLENEEIHMAKLADL